MRWCALAVLMGALCSCQPLSQGHATPSPSALEALVDQAERARTNDDREGEALALREALEKLAPDQQALAPELRRRCVDAMVEAGGHASSLALWSRMVHQQPKEKEAAEKMLRRAKEMVIRQGQELVEQVAIDEEAGQLQSALCSALAAQELFQRANAGPKERKAAEASVKRVKESLGVK